MPAEGLQRAGLIELNEVITDKKVKIIVLIELNGAVCPEELPKEGLQNSLKKLKRVFCLAELPEKGL